MLFSLMKMLILISFDLFHEQLFGAFNVPGTVLSSLHILTYRLLIETLWIISHFTEEEAEAQRG